MPRAPRTSASGHPIDHERCAACRALIAAADASPTGGDRFCPLRHAEFAINILHRDLSEAIPDTRPSAVAWWARRRLELLLEVRAVPSEWQRLLYILSTVGPTNCYAAGYARLAALVARVSAAAAVATHLGLDVAEVVLQSNRHTLVATQAATVATSARAMAAAAGITFGLPETA